jgi:hypothetical protein
MTSMGDAAVGDGAEDEDAPTREPTAAAAIAAMTASMPAARRLRIRLRRVLVRAGRL